MNGTFDRKKMVSFLRKAAIRYHTNKENTDRTYMQQLNAIIGVLREYEYNNIDVNVFVNYLWIKTKLTFPKLTIFEKILSNKKLENNNDFKSIAKVYKKLSEGENIPKNKLLNNQIIKLINAGGINKNQRSTSTMMLNAQPNLINNIPKNKLLNNQSIKLINARGINKNQRSTSTMMLNAPTKRPNKNLNSKITILSALEQLNQVNNEEHIYNTPIKQPNKMRKPINKNPATIKTIRNRIKRLKSTIKSKMLNRAPTKKNKIISDLNKRQKYQNLSINYYEKIIKRYYNELDNPVIYRKYMNKLKSSKSKREKKDIEADIKANRQLSKIAKKCLLNNPTVNKKKCIFIPKHTPKHLPSLKNNGKYNQEFSRCLLLTARARDKYDFELFHKFERYAFTGKIYKNNMQFLDAYHIELNDLLDEINEDGSKLAKHFEKMVYNLLHTYYIIAYLDKDAIDKNIHISKKRRSVHKINSNLTTNISAIYKKHLNKQLDYNTIINEYKKLKDVFGYHLKDIISYIKKNIRKNKSKYIKNNINYFQSMKKSLKLLLDFYENESRSGYREILKLDTNDGPYISIKINNIKSIMNTK